MLHQPLYGRWSVEPRNYLLSNPRNYQHHQPTQLRGITGCIGRLQIFYDFSHLHCTFVGNRGKFQEMAWQKVWPGWEYVTLCTNLVLQVCAVGLDTEFDFYASYPTWACLIVQASDRCLNLSVFLMCIICPFSLLFNWKLPNFQTEDSLRKGLMGVLCFTLSHQATYNLGMTKWISSMGQKRFLSSTGGPIPRLHQPLLLATGITWETLESQETFPIFFPQAHINYDNKPCFM